MKTPRFRRIRRFHFNLPQRVAAVLLALFLAQGLFLIARQPLTDTDFQYARCGREMWEDPQTLSGYYTSCGNIHDGVLAYRMASLPLSLSLLAERGLDHYRSPENRVVPTGAPPTTWELRHEIPLLKFLIRLPFLAAVLVLGGALWWVARRLYGNFGGYLALSLYCFSPAILKASVVPNPDILAAVAVYGGVYTCVGVAHAMQGPRRKWRPRIVLLTVIFSVAAAAHLLALFAAALLGLGLMLWVAEGRRAYLLPIILLVTAGSMLGVFASYSFSPDAFSYVFTARAAGLTFALDPVHRFFSMLPNAGVSVASLAALALYLTNRRSRYFGNTTPLLCALLLFPLLMTGLSGTPWLWALPFLFTFIGGVFADAFEGPQRRLMLTAAAAVVLLQSAFCVLCLPGLL
jgi:hypothetical protein